MCFRLFFCLGLNDLNSDFLLYFKSCRSPPIPRASLLTRRPPTHEANRHPRSSSHHQNKPMPPTKAPGPTQARHPARSSRHRSVLFIETSAKTCDNINVFKIYTLQVGYLVSHNVEEEHKRVKLAT